MKCPECKTENHCIYVGMHEIECTNISCRHFNAAAHDKWADIAEEGENLEILYKDYLLEIGD